MSSFGCRNSTGNALILFDGPKQLATIPNGQLTQNIPMTVTGAQLQGQPRHFSRQSGTFVSGNTYEATIHGFNMMFQAHGEPTVTFS